MCRKVCAFADDICLPTHTHDAHDARDAHDSHDAHGAHDAHDAHGPRLLGILHRSVFADAHDARWRGALVQKGLCFR